MRKIFLILLLSIIFLNGCEDDTSKPKAIKCVLGQNDCKSTEICVFNDDKDDFYCTAGCNPAELNSCLNGNVCEAIENQTNYGCFLPVYIEGHIFDIQTKEAIENGRVIASNKTGSFITEVYTTNDAGFYEFLIPVKRDAHGVPIVANDDFYKLNISAQDYMNYPSYFRPSIPVAPDKFDAENGRYVYFSQLTEIGLISLPAEQQNQKSISGSLSVEEGGVMIVAECENTPCPYTYTDLKGKFVLLNVANGNYKVAAYKAGLSFTSVDSVVNNANVENVILTKNENQLGTISGSVNIVNAPGGSVTSIVLIPEAIFDSTFIKGEIAPGLRAPDSTIEPNISGAYSITNIPEGKYVVLAAFENDGLVRDPDTSIAGTQIVHFTIPNNNSYTISLDNFKITEALEIVSPGANGIEEVTANPVFAWKDDSSEDEYHFELYNVYGDIVHTKTLPKSGGDDITYTYDGPVLENGMFYQFKVVSWKDKDGGTNISVTEDLKGIFHFTTAE